MTAPKWAEEDLYKLVRAEGAKSACAIHNDEEIVCAPCLVDAIAAALAAEREKGLEEAAGLLADFDPDDFELEPWPGTSMTEQKRREAELIVASVVAVLNHFAAKIRALLLPASGGVGAGGQGK